jgi:threonine/homoserine/homoserine lactone efflux protein
MYLAWSSFQSARAPVVAASRGSEVGAVALLQDERRSAFLSGMAISLTNPWAIAFWLSLGGALASLGVANGGPGAIAFFFASFMLGVVAWSLALAVFVGRMHRLMHPMVFRIVSVVCAFALGAFGVLAASRTVAFVFGM